MDVRRVVHVELGHAIGSTCGRIKSLDAPTRTGIVIVAAGSGGRKIFGLTTLNVRCR
jgi:hypothetical protein